MLDTTVKNRSLVGPVDVIRARRSSEREREEGIFTTAVLLGALVAVPLRDAAGDEVGVGAGESGESDG